MAKDTTNAETNGQLKRAGFKTAPQVLVSGGGEKGKAKLTPTQRSTYKLVKVFDEMLRDPTIRLAVAVVTAMLKRQPWTVEGPDAEINEYVRDQIWPFRERIIRSGFRGYLRDGWRSFEVVYGVSDDGLYTIDGVKALKSNQTEVLVYEDTGDLAGVINTAGRDPVQIDELHTLLINFDDEGYGDLGEALLNVAVVPHDKWKKSDEGAQRYDEKVAGGFLFIQYPVGTTPYSRRNGEETENAEIMTDLAESFKAAGYGGVPVIVDPDTGEVKSTGWKVEHVSAGGGLQPNFVARAKYLDALKLRTFGLPERAVTEGVAGTKAEAEAHGDIAVLVNLDRHERIVSDVDRQIVRAFNFANYEDETICSLVLGRLDPEDRSLFSTIFQSLMTDPVFGEQIASQVDVATLLEKLNVPTRAIDEVMEEDDALEQEEPVGEEEDQEGETEEESGGEAEDPEQEA